MERIFMTSDARRVGSCIGSVVGSIFAIVGFILVIFVAKPMIDKAERSESWPTVTGVVTHSELESHHDSDGTSYSADIHYEYRVKEEVFQGEVVWFGDNVQTNFRSSWQKVVNKYPVGQEVDVHYDPEHPEICVLEPGVFWSTRFFYLFGAVFFVVGSAILMGSAWVGRQKKKKAGKVKQESTPEESWKSEAQNLPVDPETDAEF